MHHFYLNSFLPDSSSNREYLILMLFSFAGHKERWFLSYHCFLFTCIRTLFVFIPPSEHSFKGHVPYIGKPLWEEYEAIWNFPDGMENRQTSQPQRNKMAQMSGDSVRLIYHQFQVWEEWLFQWTSYILK